jgi:hypothetical protein
VRTTYVDDGTRTRRQNRRVGLALIAALLFLYALAVVGVIVLN